MHAFKFICVMGWNKNTELNVAYMYLNGAYIKKHIVYGISVVL